MVQSHVQVFYYICHSLRLHIIPIWMACAWEGHFACSGSTKASRFILHISDLSQPSSLLAPENYAYFRTYLIANVAGIFSLFPLLFTFEGKNLDAILRWKLGVWLMIPFAESLIKIIYSITWLIFVYYQLSKRVYQCVSWWLPPIKFLNLRRFPQSVSATVLDLIEKLYLCGFLPLQLFVTFWPTFVERFNGGCIEEDCHGQENRLEFLPLMATSLYCAVGIIWAYCRLLFLYIRPTVVES
jgi:alpha-1,3-glucosyltransferase